MATINGFHHAALKARDFEKSIAFYTKALGMREKRRWGEGEGRAIMLDAGGGNILEIFAGGSGPKPEGVLVHLAFRTKDCDGMLAQARGAGAEVTMEPNSVQIASTPPTQVRIAFCKGPDGEVIEFFQSDAI
jgi:glyoxylase I family protein